MAPEILVPLLTARVYNSQVIHITIQDNPWVTNCGLATTEIYTPNAKNQPQATCPDCANQPQPQSTTTDYENQRVKNPYNTRWHTQHPNSTKQETLCGLDIVQNDLYGVYNNETNPNYECITCKKRKVAWTQ